MVGSVYKAFKSWAEKFDIACMDHKKMIACDIIQLIEVMV